MKNLQLFKCFLFLFLVVLYSSSCKVYKKVSSHHDHSIDFTKYKTFAWLPDRDTSKTEYNNQIIRNNTRNYFTKNMEERGYKTDIVNPDVFLELVVSENPKHKTVSSAHNQSFPGLYLNNPYYSAFPNTFFYQNPYNYDYSNFNVTEKVEYTEGGITLNIIDRTLNRLVWTGTAKGDLYDPATLEENLHPVVYDVLKSYPVPPITKQKRPKKNRK